MENVNYTAPQGVMSMPMVSPSDFGSGGKTKRTDIQLLPTGPQPGVIYAVVGLGTHSETYGNNPPRDMSKIHIGIEFPQLKQLFYEEDTEPRSTILSIESAFAVSSKAKLRGVIEAVIGRPFKDDNEAYNYDVTQIVGAKILVNVIEKQRKAPGTGSYNAIASVMPLGNYPLPPNFNPEIEKIVFGVDADGTNFKTMNYAKVPFYLKKIIMQSHEAKAYIAKGGLFAKLEDQQGGQSAQRQSQPQATQQAAPAQAQAAAPAPQSQEPKFVLTDTQFTLEQWKHAQWDENALVAAGKGRWELPAAPAAPSNMPLPPSASAPSPQAPAQQGPAQPTGAWLEEDDDDLPY